MEINTFLEGKNWIQKYVVPIATLYVGFTFFEPQIFSFLAEIDSDSLEIVSLFKAFNVTYISLPIFLLWVIWKMQFQNVRVDIVDKRFSLSNILLAFSLVFLMLNLISFSQQSFTGTIVSSYFLISCITLLSFRIQRISIRPIAIETTKNNTWQFVLALLIVIGQGLFSLHYIREYDFDDNRYNNTFENWKDDFLNKEREAIAFQQGISELRFKARSYLINSNSRINAKGIYTFPRYDSEQNLTLSQQNKYIKILSDSLQLIQNERWKLDLFLTANNLIIEDIKRKIKCEANLRSEEFKLLFEDVKSRSIIAICTVLVFLILVLGKLQVLRRINPLMTNSGKVFYGTYVILLITMISKVEVGHLNVSDPSFMFRYSNWYLPSYVQKAKTTNNYDQRNITVENEVDLEGVIKELSELRSQVALSISSINSNSQTIDTISIKIDTNEIHHKKRYDALKTLLD